MTGRDTMFTYSFTYKAQALYYYNVISTNIYYCRLNILYMSNPVS